MKDSGKSLGKTQIYPGEKNLVPVLASLSSMFHRGTVRSSYHSSYQNTLRGNWGYEPAKTSDYHFGASELFESDEYGADVIKGMIPEPKTLEDSNKLFNITGALLRDAFEFGRGLGIKTCVGTETPLTVPEWVKKHLQELGKDPQDAATVKELYKDLFSRIKKTYPLDYYWLWTDETWTWSDAREEQVKAVVDDLKTALEAATKEYQFVDELASLRPKVKGKDNAILARDGKRRICSVFPSEDGARSLQSCLSRQ